MRAMGSCQGVFGGWGCGIGDGDGPAPRPALGSRFRENDGGGSGGTRGGWWGRAAARRTSGYRLSPVRRWRVWEVREAETAPRRAPALGSRFRENDGGGVCGTRTLCGAGPGGALLDRLRANGIAKRACDVGWWGSAAARRTSGYRLSPVRRLAGVGSARGAGDGPAPRPALGSRFRENDGGGGVRDARELCGARALWIPGSGRTESRTTPAMGLVGDAAARAASGYRLSPLRLRANGISRASNHPHALLSRRANGTAPRPSGFLPSQE